jgi:hypothetical protein
MAELADMDQPAIRPFFEGARGRAAQAGSSPYTQAKEPSSKPK